MKLKLLFGVLLILSTLTYGQISIGEWRTHLPYHFASLVMVTDDKAFCSSTGGLFYYGLEDMSIHTLSKTDGLSDNGVVAMNWSEEDKLSVLAYENANIDILKENSVINIPDVMKKQIPGVKTIYNISYFDQKAYLASGFGVVVLDLEKYEISDTYTIGDNGEAVKVYQLSTDGEHFYAATEQGLKRASVSNPFLIDFNSWERIEDLPEPMESFSGVSWFSNKIIAIQEGGDAADDKIFYLSNDSWQELGSFRHGRCYSLQSFDNSLLITTDDGVMILNEDLLVVNQFEEGNPRSAVFDSEGVLWVADYGQGLLKIENSVEQLLKPNGPFSTIAFKMAESGGHVYSVSGGVTPIYNNIFRSAILQRYVGDWWNSSINSEIRDLIDLVVDPNDPTLVYAASWGYGLQEYQENKLINTWDENNSSLQNAVPGGRVVRIGGLDFDEDNNLWMTNAAVNEPISVKMADGEWKSFAVNGILSSFPALGDLEVTEEGHLWGIIPKGGGLFALNFNGTLDDESDDQYRLVDVVDENGSVITNEVFSFAEDHDGNLWLGTNQGILVLYSPGRLFTEGRVIAQDICIPRDDGTDICDPLLLTQKVTCIEVDGGNRKWIGTAGGGAFLVSENGLEQIYNFNTATSAILSNDISDICVEGESGEVFFGTEKGIISYRGDATKGAINYEKVVVYPNPVREDYFGPIAIKGLLEETTVKITDISGNLVRELDSFGGQAIWDGNDFKGNRVATGTYLLFLANNRRESLSAAVSKILFIH